MARRSPRTISSNPAWGGEEPVENGRAVRHVRRQIRLELGVDGASARDMPLDRLADLLGDARLRFIGTDQILGHSTRENSGAGRARTDDDQIMSPGL